MRADGKRRLSAVCPDGSIVSRLTHRDYSHVVVFKLEAREHWEAYAWSSRLDLAEKKVNEVGNWLDKGWAYVGIKILPVVNRGC